MEWGLRGNGASKMLPLLWQGFQLASHILIA